MEYVAGACGREPLNFTRELDCLERQLAGRRRAVRRRRVPGASFLCLTESRASDSAPVLLSDGSMVVAAGWLVQATRLARRLDVDPAQPTARLLGEAWLRWNSDLGHEVGGDWVFARWDGCARELILARAPSASQALYYAEGPHGPLFASLAPVLAHSGLIEKAPDWSSIATHIRHFAMLADRTAFAGIRRVRAGQVSRWRGGRWDEALIWAPSTRVDRANKDWLYDYRSTVEQAIADVLPTSGLIASQLSAGRDSSAVTAIASRLAPDRVVAITLVPRPGSVPLVRNGAIYDEGPQARKTARMLGISHELVDGGSSDQQMHWLKAVQADRHLPLWSVTAPGLWMAMACKAAELGAETMLSGGLGNLGLTSGGSPFLSALLKEEGAGDWWRVARGVARVQGWRTTLNHSSPVPLRMLRRGLLERRAAARDAPNFWRGPLADGGHIAFPRTGGLRSAREEVAAVLIELDHANPHLEALTKVRLVDPTGDRRLLELMLRVPARHLVSADGGRPLYEAAFRDVLPGELLSERRRARQAGDWYRAFDPILCRALLEEGAQHTAVREVIDVAAVQKRLERWPQDFAAASVVDDEFRLLLSSLSLALFLQQHF